MSSNTWWLGLYSTTSSPVSLFSRYPSLRSWHLEAHWPLFLLYYSLPPLTAREIFEYIYLILQCSSLKFFTVPLQDLIFVASSSVATSPPAKLATVPTQHLRFSQHTPGLGLVVPLLAIHFLTRIFVKWLLPFCGSVQMYFIQEAFFDLPRYNTNELVHRKSLKLYLTW